jgi:hypothetical protein
MQKCQAAKNTIELIRTGVLNEYAGERGPDPYST